jgi:glycosyltransferase involved in cell wall biosynthesis
LESAKVIGFFGTFFEWEGLDALITTLPRVIESVSDAKLLLAGGGRQAPRLRALVEDLRLADKVVFADRVPHRDVLAFYAAADVMAYPRVRDRLTEMVTPLKPLEAMAQGVSVVASDVGGHRELIENGRTGFLYPAGDERALAEALIGVLTSQNVDVRRIVEDARGYVERERRWSVIASRYLPIYERLLGAAKAPQPVLP